MLSVVTLTLYRLLLPVLGVLALPGWLIKMLKRGGLGTRLHERFGIFMESADFEPCGAVHIHAVSVGEVLLALKLLREWRKQAPEQTFVIAVGTATGHAVASHARLENVRVTYAPLDFQASVASYLRRFAPSRIVLIEAEVWPHLLLGCEKRGVPVVLVNARMSPRSARRYQKFSALVAPWFRRLAAIGVQEAAQRDFWLAIGIAPARVVTTGSLKIDPGSGVAPQQRREFADLLTAFGSNRQVVLAASTHDGEEALLGKAVRDAVPDALYVVVPRHAERRAEVAAQLRAVGFDVVSRTNFAAPSAPQRACLMVDSTGELRDWTAHADVVIIGKSFLAEGGQTPVEAALAAKPIVFGPHMENFEPLATLLTQAGAAVRVMDDAALIAAVHAALAGQLTPAAGPQVLAAHAGATARSVQLAQGA